MPRAGGVTMPKTTAICSKGVMPGFGMRWSMEFWKEGQG